MPRAQVGLRLVFVAVLVASAAALTEGPRSGAGYKHIDQRSPSGSRGQNKLVGLGRVTRLSGSMGYVGRLRQENARLRVEVEWCQKHCGRRPATRTITSGVRRAGEGFFEQWPIPVVNATLDTAISLDENTRTHPSDAVVETARGVLRELVRSGWKADPSVHDKDPCAWKILGCSDDKKRLLSLTISQALPGLRPGVFEVPGLSNLTLLSLRVGAKELPSSIGNLASLTVLLLQRNKLTSLPESIGNLASLTSLDLRDNKLTSLPDSIGNLASLRSLDLRGNYLTSVPDSIGNLASLRSLDLRGSYLTSVPESIGNLASLTSLLLEKNKLTSWPESIGNLARLTSLDLRGNYLTSVPESIGNLASLRSLDLQDNKLTSVPESIGNLASMTELFLLSNKLTSLPESIGNLASLTILDLQNNKLTSLPESIGNLASLTSLRLRNNKLTSVPESIGNLTRLQRLFLEYNKLTSLPESIGNLASLRKLFLITNDMASVPESIGNLTSLTTLSLDRNKLMSLTESIGNLASLIELSVVRNKLMSLPDSIGNVASLTTLDLRYNKLTSLPESIGNLASLTLLDLQDNKLTSVPESIGNLASLSLLDLQGNKLMSVPESIGNLASLKELFLQVNKLTSVPESIGNLASLTSLDLRYNQLTSLLTSIGGMTGLVALRLEHNLLSTLPQSMTNLIKLRTFTCRANMLTHLPSGIFANMTEIPRLDLSNNHLRDLPDFGDMGALVTLDVSNNKLVGLPRSLRNLVNLGHLDAHDNMLTSLPSTMGHLLRLRKLYLQNNRLVRIPHALSALKRLEELHLQENTLEEAVIHTIMPKLRYVNLSKNKLRTLQHDWFQFVPSLKTIDLSKNSLVDIPSGIVKATTLEVCELFENHITRLSREQLDWIAEARQLSISLEDNLIRGQIDEARSVPRLKGTSEVYLDRDVLKEGDSMDVLGARLLGESHVRFVANSALITRSGIGEECSFLSATNSKTSARVHVRVCQCAKGFYWSDGAARKCTPCPRHGQCDSSELRCYEGFYLRWQSGRHEAECTRCPDHAMCDSNVMQPMPGAWWDVQYALGPTGSAGVNASVPATYQTNSDLGRLVFECRNREACVGGSNATCNLGYTGHLCSTCSRGYFSSGHGICERCPDPSSSLGLMVLSAAMGAMVMTALLFRGVNTNTSPSGNDSELLNLLEGSFKDDSMTVVRVLVAFLQIIVSLDVVFAVEWPDLMHVWDDLFGWVALDWLKSSSFECLWEYAAQEWWSDDGFTGFSFSYYVSLILTSGVVLATSIALLCLHFILLAAEKVVKRRGVAVLGGGGGQNWSGWRMMQGRCLQMMVVLWLLAYLPVSSKAMGFFLCDTFNGGVTYWLHDDLSIRCYTSEYYAHAPVAVATLAVYTIGFPVLVVGAFLFVHSRRLHRTRSIGGKGSRGSGLTGTAWATVSRAYRPEYGYWEAVEMARKLLVGAAAMHFGSTPTFQLTVALLIAFVAAVLHFYCRPYRTARAQRYAGINLVLIYFTMSLGLLDKLDVDPAKRSVFAGTVLVSDGVFVAVLMGLILWDLGEAVRTQGLKLVGHAWSRAHLYWKGQD